MGGATPGGNLRGALLMAASAAVFAAEALMVRWMTERGIPTATQLLARCLGQLLWVLPALLRVGAAGVFRTHRPGLHLLRGGASLVTWALYFLSLGMLDLATATVLSFTNVMFTTLLAGPVLGERVGAARWAGTLLGLLGVAAMLRPGADVPLAGAVVGIGAAAAWCAITLSSRALARTERTETVLAWVAMVTLAGVLPWAAWSWQPLDGGDLLVMALFGSVTPAILWLLIEALRRGEASAVAPFQYLRLPVVAGAAWLLLGEVPAGSIWLGAGLILLGALAVTVSEARRARR